MWFDEEFCGSFSFLLVQEEEPILDSTPLKTNMPIEN